MINTPRSLTRKGKATTDELFFRALREKSYCDLLLTRKGKATLEKKQAQFIVVSHLFRVIARKELLRGLYFQEKILAFSGSKERERGHDLLSTLQGFSPQIDV